MIPRFVGHERYSGAIAGQALAHLYGAMRLYVNYFQPSFQLLSKSRNGGSVTKRYSKPATPCDRLLDRDDVSEEMKSRLRQNHAALDPVSLQPYTEVPGGPQGAQRSGIGECIRRREP